MTGWEWDLMVFAYAGVCVAAWRVGYLAGYRRGKADAEIEALQRETRKTEQRFRAWQARHAARRGRGAR